MFCGINLSLGGLRGTYQKAVYKTKFSKKKTQKNKIKPKKKKEKRAYYYCTLIVFCFSKIATQFEGTNEIY